MPQSNTPAAAQQTATSSTARTNGFAIASLIVSLVVFGPLGVILGIVALIKIGKTGEKGKGLAIAGIIIGCITTLIFFSFMSSLGSASKTLQQVGSSSSNTSAPTNTQNSTPSEAPAAPVPTVTAKKLVADYNDNQLSADKKYKDKVYKITGTIDDFGSELTGDPYVTLVGDGYFNTARCDFPGDATDAISKLKKGQSVTFQGKVYGDLIGSVSVNDCSIIK